MLDKLKKGISKAKPKLIIALILWIILVLFCIAPLVVTMEETKDVNNSSGIKFFEKIGEYIKNPILTLPKAFSEEYISKFWSITWKFLIIYVVIFIVATYKAIPKTEYSDIEHGSSDWCEHGEQYKILSKNKGIILAEKHFLPTNKRGNVNVLVVGRFWFW